MYNDAEKGKFKCVLLNSIQGWGILLLHGFPPPHVSSLFVVKLPPNLA